MRGARETQYIKPGHRPMILQRPFGGARGCMSCRHAPYKRIGTSRSPQLGSHHSPESPRRAATSVALAAARRIPCSSQTTTNSAPSGAGASRSNMRRSCGNSRRRSLRAGPHAPRRCRLTKRRPPMANKKRVPSTFVAFDVVYEGGSRSSNRRVPGSILGGPDGDLPATAAIEEQDREIEKQSGRPCPAIRSIVRSVF